LGGIGFAGITARLPDTGRQQSEGEAKDLCAYFGMPLQFVTAYQHKD
jgi:hypothetical protein